MTLESVQAMIDQALLRNSTNRDGSHSSYGDNRRNVQTTCPFFYADFMKCQPLNFKGTEGGVGLTWWIEKMESVFHISVLKKKMTEEYCPQGEIKKLEIELWNLKFGANKTEKVNKYISGLPDNIYGNVKYARPKTICPDIFLSPVLLLVMIVVSVAVIVVVVVIVAIVVVVVVMVIVIVVSLVVFPFPFIAFP
ncbi:hypothetical protein Tco_0056275, partial [Tanacetum coccineum]